VLRIGFEFPEYRVDEPDNEIFYGEITLVKNIVSEQTYFIAIGDNEFGTNTATGDTDPIIPPGSGVDIRDYIGLPENFTVQIFPFQQSIPFVLTLFSDESPEGDEAFQLVASPVDSLGPQFSVPIATAPFTAATVVRILDNDRNYIAYRNFLYNLCIYIYIASH